MNMKKNYQMPEATLFALLEDDILTIAGSQAASLSENYVDERSFGDKDSKTWDQFKSNF